MTGLPIQSLRRLALGARAAGPLLAGPRATAAAPTALRAARTASTATSSAAAPSAAEAAKATTPVVPYKRYRKPQPELAKFPEGHGEQIWVYCHMVSNQVVYSHRAVLKASRILKQLPFNGKLTRPAKLRKDYWRPMALVQFEAGDGVTGRSVFQKLREFRRMHELDWGNRRAHLLQVSREERGRILNDQRSNSIADLAAVLAGAGTGNRIRAVNEAGAVSELHSVTVFWDNDQDRKIAEGWSSNVRHVAGIPDPNAKPAPAYEAEDGGV